MPNELSMCYHAKLSCACIARLARLCQSMPLKTVYEPVASSGVDCRSSSSSHQSCTNHQLLHSTSAGTTVHAPNAHAVYYVRTYGARARTCLIAIQDLARCDKCTARRRMIPRGGIFALRIFTARQPWRRRHGTRRRDCIVWDRLRVCKRMCISPPPPRGLGPGRARAEPFPRAAGERSSPRGGSRIRLAGRRRPATRAPMHLCTCIQKLVITAMPVDRANIRCHIMMHHLYVELKFAGLIHTWNQTSRQLRRRRCIYRRRAALPCRVLCAGSQARTHGDSRTLQSVFNRVLQLQPITVVYCSDLDTAKGVEGEGVI